MHGSDLPLRTARRYDAKGAVAPSNKGDNEAVSYTRPYRKTGDLLVGSWARTVAVLAVALVVFGVIAWAAASGSLATVGTWNIPLIHPYPPAGFNMDPLSKGQLVDAKQAAVVRKDFQADGQLEVAAFAKGDASQLPSAETGNYLTSAQQLIARNNAEGVYEQAQNQIEKLLVGRLVDPNRASEGPLWCVRETGSTTISFVDKASGRVARQQQLRFDSKYWLVRSGDRYLITDAQLSTSPISNGG